MSAINPISGPRPPAVGPPAAGAQRDAGGKVSGFGRLLQGCIEQADGGQQASAAAIEKLLTGQTQDVLPVVAEVAKADLSFKLLIGVRDKVIEAYKQTMSMQL
jgi:flagellar hook-basal body complex protein FliE